MSKQKSGRHYTAPLPPEERARRTAERRARRDAEVPPNRTHAARHAAWLARREQAAGLTPEERASAKRERRRAWLLAYDDRVRDAAGVAFGETRATWMMENFETREIVDMIIDGDAP